MKENNEKFEVKICLKFEKEMLKEQSNCNVEQNIGKKRKGEANEEKEEIKQKEFIKKLKTRTANKEETNQFMIEEEKSTTKNFQLDQKLKSLQKEIELLKAAKQIEINSLQQKIELQQIEIQTLKEKKNNPNQKYSSKIKFIFIFF
jgi:hypothetical protein